MEFIITAHNGVANYNLIDYKENPSDPAPHVGWRPKDSGLVPTKDVIKFPTKAAAEKVYLDITARKKITAGYKIIIEAIL